MRSGCAGKLGEAGASLPARKLITLNPSSTRRSLSKYLPASNSVLVGIASGWPNFLKNARTMLIAAGFAPESLVFAQCFASWVEARAEASAFAKSAVSDWLAVKHDIPSGWQIIVVTSRTFRCIFESASDEELICDTLQRDYSHPNLQAVHVLRGG